MIPNDSVDHNRGGFSGYVGVSVEHRQFFIRDRQRFGVAAKQIVVWGSNWDRNQAWCWTAHRLSCRWSSERRSVNIEAAAVYLLYRQVQGVRVHRNGWLALD